RNAIRCLLCIGDVDSVVPMRTLRILLVLLIASAACGEPVPTQPTYAPRGRSTGLRTPVCVPVQVEVHCTVAMRPLGYADIDVTNSATWMVADSNLSTG